MPMFVASTLAIARWKKISGRFIVLLAWWVLLIPGCATSLGDMGGGGPGGSNPSGLLSPQEQEEATEAEALLTRAQIKAVASLAREKQARLTFIFWVEHGAFTLTAYSAQGRGAPTTSAAPGVNGLDDALMTVVTRYAEGQTGQMRVAARRAGSAWTVDGHIAHSEPRPPEAKMLPVRRAGVPAATVQALTQGVKELLREVRVPEGGAVMVEVEVQMEDDRVEH